MRAIAKAKRHCRCPVTVRSKLKLQFTTAVSQRHRTAIAAASTMKDDASEPLDRFSPTLTNDDDAAMQPLEENGAAAAEVVAASDDTLLNAPKRDAAEFASVKQIHKAPVPVADPIAPLNDPKAEYETTPKVSGMEADLKDPDIIAMSFPEKVRVMSNQLDFISHKMILNCSLAPIVCLCSHSV